jgi:hypothetical protein
MNEQLIHLSVPLSQDAYTWQVFYEDGAAVREHDEAEGVSWSEATRKTVSEIALCSASSGREIRHIVQVPEGAIPVFFRRRSLMIDPMATEGDGKYQATAHCIGWKREETGEEVYQFILEHGASILTSDLQAI